MSSRVKPLTQVELEQKGKVATIRFTTEGDVNIFSSRVLGELGTCVDRLAQDAAIRFVVLRGVGRTFLAGADINELAAYDEERAHALTTHGHHVVDAIEALPQVTIAALNGHALGGGCGLALACDFRILVANALIGQPEARLGLTTGWGGTKRLPKLVGSAHARRLLYSGQPPSADEALKIGLVDEVVPTADDLDDALRRWFEFLSGGSPAAIRRLKHAMLHGDEITQFGLSFSCSDAKEGMHAFLEKRPPSWSTWADCTSDG